MDYLLRDSYFTGVEYGKVDIHRIIDSLASWTTISSWTTRPSTPSRRC